MLTTLMLVAAQALPIMPPGAVPKPAPSYSPKYSEQLASSGTKMVRVQAPAPYVPPTGFVITNLSVQNGVVSLAWQQGQPLFQIQGGELHGWTNLGPLTTAQSKSFPQGTVPHFFRITQSNSMPLTLNSTNQPRLQWQAPEIDMSDSIDHFQAYKTTDPAISQTEPPGMWTPIGGVLAGTATSLNDTTAPPVYYTLRGTTANGVKIPYVGQSLSLSASGDVAWKTDVIGPANAHFGDAVTTDSQGNIYLVGNFGGPLTIQGHTITGSGNGWNLFLAKFTPSGGLTFLKKYGASTGNIYPGSIAVDSSGNIAVGGAYSGTGNFGGQNFTSNGENDCFVARYDSGGNHSWSAAWGSPEASAGDKVTSVGMDASGNVIVAGYITTIVITSVYINIGGISKYFYGSGGQVFIVKFTAAGSGGLGVGSWAANISTSGVCKGVMTVNHRIDPATGLQDTILLLTKAQTSKLGGDQFGIGSTQYGDRFVLSKWRNDTGAYITSSEFSDATGDVMGVTVDSNSDVITTGFFYYDRDNQNTPNFGGGPMNNASIFGNLFIAKHAGSDFHTLWAAWASSTGYLATLASAPTPWVTVDDANNVFMAATFQQFLNFYNANDYINIKKTVAAWQAGTSGIWSSDVCLVKYSGANGTLMNASGGGYWAFKYGADDPVSDRAFGVTVSSGAPVVAGDIWISGLDCVMFKAQP